MPLDAGELIIGPAFMSIDGNDMGFINTDGVNYNPEHEGVEYESSQTAMVVAYHRTKVRAVLAATFNQLSLAKWQVLEDIKDAPASNTLVGSWDICGPTVRNIVLTMPGPGCSTRTMTARGVVMTPGEKVFNNGEYTGAPVEFLLLGDPVTEKIWTVVETPSSATAPAIASTQYITGAGTETTFADGATTVPDDAVAIQGTFNVAIRTDMLANNRIMLVDESGNIVAGTYAYGVNGANPDYTKVKFTPASALSASTDYSFIVVPGIVSMTGKAGSGSTVQFTTTA